MISSPLLVLKCFICLKMSWEHSWVSNYIDYIPSSVYYQLKHLHMGKYKTFQSFPSCQKMISSPLFGLKCFICLKMSWEPSWVSNYIDYTKIATQLPLPRHFTILILPLLQPVPAISTSLPRIFLTINQFNFIHFPCLCFALSTTP